MEETAKPMITSTEANNIYIVRMKIEHDRRINIKNNHCTNKLH